MPTPLIAAPCALRAAGAAVAKSAIATLVVWLFLASNPATAQPALHDAWSELLERCVVATADGHSTAADYGCFADHRDALQAYLTSLGQVARPTYDAWSRDQRLAFLINAYNAWTVDLILSAWPDLDSIRDLGNLLRSPWQREFIPLLGATLSLDDIEHGMIREPGSFDDPRIHFAVNCASVGCPALRREAYRATALERQLEEQTAQFLGDPSRNRFREGQLALSPLFKWYRKDFEGGWRGTDGVAGFVARYAQALQLDSATEQALRAGKITIRFLDYDWSLNASGK